MAEPTLKAFHVRNRLYPKCMVVTADDMGPDHLGGVRSCGRFNGNGCHTDLEQIFPNEERPTWVGLAGGRFAEAPSVTALGKLDEDE
jgi:hypothetical protein